MTKKKILILGVAGMLGHTLFGLLSKSKDLDIYATARSAEEMRAYLQKCGMIEIETVYAGNGVEARARK